MPMTPSSSSKAHPPNPPQNQNQKQYPELHCKCAQPCVVLTSRSKNNPGKDYYKCQKWQTREDCKFFQWCNEPRGTNSPAKQAQPEHPICMCTAGPCRVETYQVEGPLKGCKYYACHLKKGQGACGQFDWYCSPIDISETINNHAGNELALTRNIKYEEPMDDGTKDVHSFQPPTPPTSRSEHEHVGQRSSSPRKKLNNIFEGSPSKRKRVEEWLSDSVDSLTISYYVSEDQKCPAIIKGEIEAPVGLIPKSPHAEKRDDVTRNLTLPIRRLTDCCYICGEGHSVSECVAECMEQEM